MSEWLWVVGGESESDEPRWFRDQLEQRVDEALNGSSSSGTIKRSIVPPHYLLGANPSQASDVVINGANVGFESLTGSAERPGYRGVVQMTERLPALSITARRARVALGARTLSGVAEADARFNFSTSAPRLPRALLRHERFARALAGATPFNPSLFIEPTTSGAELAVAIGNATHEAIAAGMALVRALHEAASATAGDVDVLSTAGTTSVIDEGQIEGLLQAVVGATSWLAGDVARVGDGVEARLVLDDAALQHRASLTATMTTTATLRLRAELPDHVEAFTLTPQRGWRAMLGRIAELEIGDAAVDDAFVIMASTTATETLRARRLELLRLAECDCVVKSAPGTLEVEVTGITPSPVDVADAATAALALWRGLVVANA